MKAPGLSIRSLLVLMVLCCTAVVRAEPPSPSAVSLPTFTDIEGKTHTQAEVQHSKATAFVFVSTQCPIANLYTPRLIELGHDYSQHGVSLFLVDSNTEDSLAEVRRYAHERAFPFPVVKDRGTLLADRLGASRTPEAVILDSACVVRYRGRIDDSVNRDKVVRQNAREALDAILAGKPVPHPRLLAIGCAIFREITVPATTTEAVTYTRDVAPILDRNCVKCHRSGEIAPFALETYQQAHTWAAAIRDYTARRLMPPWKAEPGYGEFHDATVITSKEIAVLAKWAGSGAPQGNPKERPAPPKFAPPGAWTLGPPDLILRPSRPYHLGAEGDDVYREYVLPLDLSQDVYLRAVEFKPDNRAIVHHIIAYFDPTGKTADFDNKEAEPGYSVPGVGIGISSLEEKFIAGWAPGNTPHLLPAGAAYKLSKDGKLVLQVHYHRDGKPETDQCTVGLYFAKGSVDREMRVWAALNTNLNLEPGMTNQRVKAEFTLPVDVHVWAASPHMHLIGRQMKMTALLPNGKTIPMIWIKDWDFNWQDSYIYKEPLALPKGTKVLVEAVYDNTEANPRQPTLPPKLVHWGEQTTDEMCIGFFTVTVDAEHLDIPAIKTASR